MQEIPKVNTRCEFSRERERGKGGGEEEKKNSLSWYEKTNNERQKRIVKSNNVGIVRRSPKLTGLALLDKKIKTGKINEEVVICR